MSQSLKVAAVLRNSTKSQPAKKLQIIGDDDYVTLSSCLGTSIHNKGTGVINQGKVSLIKKSGYRVKFKPAGRTRSGGSKYRIYVHRDDANQLVKWLKDNI